MPRPFKELLAKNAKIKRTILNRGRRWTSVPAANFDGYWRMFGNDAPQDEQYRSLAFRGDRQT